MKIPERLGKYRITGVVGKGAMGVVYLGHDPVIKRRVAIKTIRKEAMDDEERAESLSERFRREAQAAGALNHPGIVSVYEYGEDEQFAFIAMEYVEGNTLRDYLSHGAAFDERDTVSIMSQLLDALQFAHANAVWHRDIKPGNIIIMGNGRAKLADFGIARIESGDRTRTNLLMGTPGYIAPEYYLGEPIDHRIDLFSAGAIFYELLARQAPFRGRPEAIMHDVCYHDPDPPSEVDPQHRWPHYDPIAARALAKTPSARFQSADEFRTELLAEYAQPVSSTISDATIIARPMRPVRSPEASTPSASRTPSFANSTLAPSDWSTPVLAGVEIELARFVGPVAKVLVRRAARTHKDIDSLVLDLLETLDRSEDREAFTKAVTGRPMIMQRNSQSAPTEAATPRNGPAGPVLTPADIERAAQLLTPYIGPIARVVARRAAVSGMNRHDFMQELALNLENKAQRERFLREALVSGG